MLTIFKYLYSTVCILCDPLYVGAYAHYPDIKKPPFGGLYVIVVSTSQISFFPRKANIFKIPNVIDSKGSIVYPIKTEIIKNTKSKTNTNFSIYSSKI